MKDKLKEIPFKSYSYNFPVTINSSASGTFQTYGEDMIVKSISAKIYVDNILVKADDAEDTVKLYLKKNGVELTREDGVDIAILEEIFSSRNFEPFLLKKDTRWDYTVRHAGATWIAGSDLVEVRFVLSGDVYEKEDDN